MVAKAQHHDIEFLPDGDNGGSAQRVATTAVQLRSHQPTKYRPPMLDQYLSQPDHPTAEPVAITYTPR